MTIDIAEVHHVVETTINVLSIIFNCYLLYLIKYYSTFGVKLYRYLLTVDAALDLFLGIFTLLVQPMVPTAPRRLRPPDSGFVSEASRYSAARTLALS
ncbi:serpentine type 7TM GPCR chemoreceptor str domain-containing protein [Ditylenchus destructor]|nr:serpentine type 7TM GPCR chemoreceptor str domain-containing protein [Ditylenchus destructor]